MLKRPKLDSTPLPNPFPEPGAQYITCSPGQWDAMLKGAYESGWTLLEIEEVKGEEKAVRAWKKHNDQSLATAGAGHPKP